MDNLTELGAITAVILSNSFVPTLQKLTPFFENCYHAVLQNYRFVRRNQYDTPS